MPEHVAFAEELRSYDPQDVEYATSFIDRVLAEATRLHASDIHLQPTASGLEVRWRLDGVLQLLGEFPSGEASHVVTRLKVLADLLTYRMDIPQEGRIQRASDIEMRVSTFPTLHGERAVIRLFAAAGQYLYLRDLGLPDDVQLTLASLLQETAGAILITGPAGSGKSTTAYALLRELASAEIGKSLVSLEDPIEVVVPGVVQSQLNSSAGFDMALGLRSIMRQDPETIMIGEVRDRETAEGAFQAALTGHLVITTFHSGSAAEAISRLADMDIEPYQLRSSLLAIVNQRLVRRLCSCAESIEAEAELLGLNVSSAKRPVGCDECLRTGYRGRAVLAELLLVQRNDVGRAILSRSDAPQLEHLAIDAGMTTCQQRAIVAVENGTTSPAEVRRVFGFQA